MILVYSFSGEDGSLLLERSMSLVALSESGYSLSSIDLLKSWVRIGEREVLTSLIILGLIGRLLCLG